MKETMQPPISPLVGVAKRQAMSSIEGYDYQIWRTVEAWLSLGVGELLFIECAEDYDVLSPDGSVANQVKNSPEDISLGSADVRSAIVNYWRMRQDNPNAPRPTLRFLTRGGIRAEKASLFGERKGLEVWRSAAGGDEEDAVLLARDLEGRIGDQDLLAFLVKADVVTLCVELFSRIEWVVEQPDFEQIRLVVKHLVRRLGQEQGASMNRSDAAVPALLEHCRDIARMKRSDLRRLSQADLKDQFIAAISISLPVTARAEAAIAKMFFDGGQSSELQFSVASEFDRPPPIPVDPIVREGFATSIAEALSASGAALISGSVGRGKSAATALATIGAGGSPLWIELEGLDTVSAASTLERALVVLRTVRARGFVAIDGLPDVAAVPRMVWLRFYDLLCECRQQGRPLLASAQGVNSAQIDSRFNEQGVAILNIPDIEIEEIEGFFLGLHCPPELCRPWAALTELHSGGHPKLIHLRGRELKAKGWPEPEEGALDHPGQSVEGARSSARALVAKTVAPLDIELLYGLSLALLDFDRGIAMSVAGKIGDATTPGDSFDRLVGSWIEERAGGDFRVTALLTGQAPQAWSERKTQVAHGAICESFMRRMSLRVDQAMPILLHALASKDTELLNGFIEGVARGNALRIPGLAQNLAPLTLMVSSAGQLLFPSCPETSLKLRMLQFRIASANDDPIVVALANAWRWEIDHCDTEDLSLPNATMWGICVSSTFSEADFPIETLVCAIAEVVRGADDIAALAERRGLSSRAALTLAHGSETDSVAGNLLGFASPKVRSVDTLRRLLDSLSVLEDSVRTAMLQAFGIGDMRDNLQFFASTFLGLCQAENPDWEAFIVECARAEQHAYSWECTPMALASLRIRADVLSDRLKKHDAAIDLLADGMARHRGSNDLLAQMGVAHFNAGRYREALAVFELSLDKSLDRPEASSFPFFMRLAALASHKVDDTINAALWFEAGAGAARRIGMDEQAVGLDLDAVHCWILLDRWIPAVNALLRVHAKVAAPVIRAEQPGLFAMREMTRRVVDWSKGMADTKCPRVEEVGVGICSNSKMPWDRLPDSVKPFDATSAGIVVVARAKKISSPEIEAIRRLLENSDIPLISSAMWVQRAEDQFAAGEFTSIAKSLTQITEGHWRMQCLLRLDVEAETFDSNSMVVNGADREGVFNFKASMAVACLLHSIEGKSVTELVDAWTHELKDSPHAAWFIPQVSEVSRVMGVDFDDAQSIVSDETTTLLEKIGAAAVILGDGRQSPPYTAWCQLGSMYWIIATDTSAKRFLMAAIDRYADQFCGLWRRHAEQPWLVDQSQANTGMLHDALDSSGSGASRLIRLFEAVKGVASVEIPAALREVLEEARRAG